MECQFFQTQFEYDSFKEDHILVSFRNYYNHANCMINFILSLYPVDNPETITPESASELLRIISENEETNKYVVCFVGNDVPVIKQIYHFLLKVSGECDVDATSDMRVFAVLNNVWQTRFNIKMKKRWNKSNPRRFVDDSTIL